MLCGVLASVVQTHLLARALSECEIGGPGNGFGLILQWPILIVVDIVVIGLVVFSVRRGASRLVDLSDRRTRIGVGVLAFLAVLLAVALLLWALLARWIPEDYPEIVCPGNVPPWWPSWLPI